ncbi:hypothetical protein BU24DRAFT_427744 [Aaosphaeria arxii CBS 175.79]|uniref:WSC domain-containing protein n=1 Tax=Aaosphaeria arxii CBS 175.79 TaxID=1450172 RepID=A0A6A5XCC8_9PLEO|nr:uncharacterized protein BU24DRAFT_427744 [Aaosphaeria arxii CBS 175.79]KAF2010628.1 hypothetical protein BU24DRAFT_427744 [Aaosphaeria arxii CBS 175.79]
MVKLLPYLLPAVAAHLFDSQLSIPLEPDEPHALVPHLLPRQIPDPTPPPEDSLPQGWEYAGCWSTPLDPATQLFRDYTPQGYYLAPWDYTSFTNAAHAVTCIDFCNVRSYSFAGTLQGDRCWCAHALQGPGALSTNNALVNFGCDARCTDPAFTNEACGGASFVSVYTNHAPFAYPQPAAQNSLPERWEYLGCYVAQDDNPQTLTLGGAGTNYEEDITATTCIEYCQTEAVGAPFEFAGTTNRGYCSCGNQITGGTSRLLPPDPSGTEPQCVAPCTGDDSQVCGGNNRITIYGIEPPEVRRESLSKDCYLCVSVLCSHGEYRCFPFVSR